MFLGTRDLFTYAECGRCGSLQLCNPPNLDPYYQSDGYKPLQQKSEPTTGPLNRFVRLVATEIRLRTMRDYRHWSYPLRLAGVSRQARILDVGCGRGKTLRDLRRQGFRHLTGIDPYTPASTEGVTIINGTLDSYRGGAVDIVMMNDSLEHVPDPLTTLTQAKGCLAEDGRAIVRIPVAGTFAWRTYGVDWIQLDAPRHIHIPTENGMRMLGDRAGLRIVQSFYDSSSFQFWGSELYKQDIPFNDPRRPIFSHETIDEWERLAERLNESRDGDHAIFILAAQT